MKLYIDIDGVILTKNGKASAHLDEFLEFALSNFDCYWLTTHCKGDIAPAISYLYNKIPPKSYDLIHKIKPTNWQTWKTEAINFEEDFMWLDDYIMDAEMRILEKNNCEFNFLLQDLSKFPSQLLDTMEFLKGELEN